MQLTHNEFFVFPERQSCGLTSLVIRSNNDEYVCVQRVNDIIHCTHCQSGNIRESDYKFTCDSAINISGGFVTFLDRPPVVSSKSGSQ